MQPLSIQERNSEARRVSDRLQQRMTSRFPDCFVFAPLITEKPSQSASFPSELALLPCNRVRCGQGVDPYNLGRSSWQEEQTPVNGHELKKPRFPGLRTARMHRMKALLKHGPEKGIRLQEVPVPEIGNGDLLVKIRAAAICGTDLHIYNWDDWARRTVRPPLIIGHEFVGEIVDCGVDVKGFEVGQRVSGEGHIVCGTCRSCRAGRRHLCTNAIGIGVNRDGCFAEYLCLPASNAWSVHPCIPSDIAAFLDPFGNATHAALSFDLVGEDVLITGAGPIGIMAVAIARHVGARNIVISDVNPYRLSLAKSVGATRAVNVAETSIEAFVEELGMVGFDIGLEMSGNAGAFESMLRNMYHGGRIALLGILPNTARIDWDQIIFKGLMIKGIYGREIFETWYKMETMLQSGLNISGVLTHRFRFEEHERAFETVASGRCGKVILEWG